MLAWRRGLYCTNGLKIDVRRKRVIVRSMLQNELYTKDHNRKTVTVKRLVQPLAVRMGAEIHKPKNITDKAIRSGNPNSKALFALVSNLMQFPTLQPVPEFYRLVSARARLIDPRAYELGYYDHRLDAVESEMLSQFNKIEMTVVDVATKALSAAVFRISFKLDDTSGEQLDRVFDPLDELPRSHATGLLEPDPTHDFFMDLPTSMIRPNLLARKRGKPDAIDKLKRDIYGTTIRPGIGLSVAKGTEYSSRQNQLTYR